MGAQSLQGREAEEENIQEEKKAKSPDQTQAAQVHMPDLPDLRIVPRQMHKRQLGSV